MLFLFKKYVGAMVMPLPLILLISLAALFLLWFTRWQKTGKTVLTLSWLTLLLLSLQPVADKLLLPLESVYAKAYQPDPSHINPPVDYIVVLGGGFTYNPNWAPSSNLFNNSLPRVTEGIRLYRLNPGAKMVFTGGKGESAKSNAEVAAIVAQSLGVPAEDTIALTKPMDTEQEAHEVEKLIGKRSFILVTSANHMPRAITFFKQRGLNPIPGPANQLAITSSLHPWEKYLPSTYYLSHSERVWYETLGTLWQRIKPSKSSEPPQTPEHAQPVNDPQTMP
ncbi:envelope biogenesis factor ElyC [Photorhabdus khanii]|uniref:Envelope biogenesis factor ElyC n=1 Tax=Photorhabdus khanii TaxID=1004150 RepID=A0A7C9KD87_9GAMM|nr:envelope biogenesis factor ElyC [Photorhabdus khanii]MQL48501.1 envelope biogenesis factor ElyC [Photorhabdus khanii]